MSYSLFYGRPYQGEFNQWSTRELERDVASPSIDPATKAAIEHELFLRMPKKMQRKISKGE